jgi:hypothetical protein
MSKAVSSTSLSEEVCAGRNHWTPNSTPLRADEEEPTPPKKSSSKRFVEPYLLDTEQREAILSRLQELDIGDEESRSLFVAALEYDLAGCSDLLAPAQEHSTAEREGNADEVGGVMDTLTEAAEKLANELARLDATASLRLRQELEMADRFRGSYGEDYLATMSAELRRLAEFVRSSEGLPGATAPSPTFSDEARLFVLRVADAYETCFDLVPAAQSGSPFASALEAIVTATRVCVPTDQAALIRIFDRA